MNESPDDVNKVDSVEHFPVRDRLHSDVLEDKYGPIHSEVLRHDDTHEVREEGKFAIREAHLCDEDGISRTYALTFLSYDPKNIELYEIDQAIRDGGMIGKTFREHNFIIKKNVIDVFVLQLTPAVAEKMRTNQNFAKARMSEFYARRADEVPLVYGQVLEVYTPDFREPLINTVDMAQINPSTDIMEKFGISRDEIWQHLDKASEIDEWKDHKDEYEKARIESLGEVFLWRNRIQQYLSTK